MQSSVSENGKGTERMSPVDQENRSLQQAENTVLDLLKSGDRDSRELLDRTLETARVDHTTAALAIWELIDRGAILFLGDRRDKLTLKAATA
jgi:hypothetical protein